jgi:hypothetical protein
MDTFQLVLAYAGYVVATVGIFSTVALWRMSNEKGNDRAESHAAAGLTVFGGSVVIALLSAILHRLVIN